jgi:hypothetical protein
MTIRRLLPIILAAILATVLVSSAAAAPQTFTGVVTDTMCGKKHMMPGKSDAECTRECMKSKGSWTYGLVVGDKVYSLDGDNKQFDALAGKRVKVTGEASGTKLKVASIAPAN